MFIKNDTDTIFEVIRKHDNCSDPEDRWKEMRHGVYSYNADNGTKHEFTSELLNQYWQFLRANNLLTEPNYQ